MRQTLKWRDKLFRWLFGWCAFPKCDCNLDAGEQKCRKASADTKS